MPKRAYPFEHNFLPQLKIHVEDKHVDNGVKRDERMQQVYGKTMNLLRQGSKELSRKLNTSADENSFNVLPADQQLSCQLKCDRNLKQMRLNNKLELEAAPGLEVESNDNLCGCCRVIDKGIVTKCYYCDQILCFYCLSECTKCFELYCQNCCLPKYETEDVTVCLNCY